MANIPKIQKALYPHIPKIDPRIIFTKKYPVSLEFWANIPVSLKNLPGPKLFWLTLVWNLYKIEQQQDTLIPA